MNIQIEFHFIEPLKRSLNTNIKQIQSLGDTPSRLSPHRFVYSSKGKWLRDFYPKLKADFGLYKINSRKRLRKTVIRVPNRKILILEKEKLPAPSKENMKLFTTKLKHFIVGIIRNQP